MGHDARCSAEASAKWQNKVTIVVAEEAIRRALTLLKCSKITLTKLSFLTAAKGGVPKSSSIRSAGE
jgi:hypothetical protein